MSVIDFFKRKIMNPVDYAQSFPTLTPNDFA